MNLGRNSPSQYIRRSLWKRKKSM